MEDSITVQTDSFEHREAKAHFINPCCFGEDFCSLAEKRTATSHGVWLQEDYGWGFWVHYGSDPLWVACSCVGEGPQEAPAEWVVSVAYDPGLNLFKRVFHRPDAEGFTQLRNRIRQILKSNHAIRIVPPET